MNNIFAGKTLEDIADIRQLRRKRLYITFSIIAMCLFGAYSIVNLIVGRNAHSVVNLFGFVLGCISYLKLTKSDAYNSPLLLNIAILVNAAGHVFLPERILLWVYPAIATVIIINQFRAALISTTVFSLFTGCFFFAEKLGLIPYEFTFNIPNEKFFISYLITCIACLASNLYYKNAAQYLKKLYLSGIEELAYLDSLTGLANRNSFMAWAEEKLKTSNPEYSASALLFIDLDNFKTINDTEGHDKGDFVLHHFAQRLYHSVRHTDRKTDEKDFSVCRYAGDEFVVLLSDLPSREALLSVLERICNLDSDKIETKAGIQNLTFSIGVSVYGQDADSLDKLISKADTAMYAAKRAGKNRYCFYSSSMDSNT